MTETLDSEQLTFKIAFDSDPEVMRFPSSALSLFTLSLYLRLDDLGDFAANAVTEGPGDKKADICHIDVNESRAIIVQSYLAEEWDKAAAPSNKASDLNTAMAWLLSAPEDRIPPGLRTKAIDLRRAIQNAEIRRIEIFYIHNCFESTNVEDELRAVAAAARDLTRTMVIAGDPPVVSHREFGLRSIEELYRARESEILVDGWIEIPATHHIEESGEGWRAILTTVPGAWIQDLHRAHGDRLFSANYRDYLGSTKRSGNINYEITQTAESEPGNFWVYNNGITALTYEIQLTPGPRIRGISIINGAQTSGALSDATPASTECTNVLMRVVECRSREIIDKIIRFNNTQNEIRPADRRSNDRVQKKLGDEFARHGVLYIHRRSSPRVPRNALTAAGIAPALCAFHGDPQIAYRNSKVIFLDDDVYDKVFSKSISIEHIFLVKSLSSAIDSVKTDLNARVAAEIATGLEQRQYEVLKYSASKHFIFYLVGGLAEEIMGRRISDLFQWKCAPGLIAPSNLSLQKAWVVALVALLPQIATIVETLGEDAFYEVPRSLEKSKTVSKHLKALIASLSSTLGGQFDELRQRSTA